MPDSPFDLAFDTAYLHWRERKLAEAPTRLEDLIVEIDDPRRLTPSRAGGHPGALPSRQYGRLCRQDRR
jgi:hypothetical protein